MTSRRRPKPWAETSRQGLTRYVWRFERRRHWTPFYEDPEEARADATAQISQQLQGTWRDHSGRRMLLEEWIDVWVQMRDVEPTTLAKDRYLVEFHILPQFQGSELGSLAFEEIEAWEQAIPTRISATGRPYARSVAKMARDLLITILGDAVHAGKIDRNPAQRRRGRRGRMRARGRVPSVAAQQGGHTVVTPFQAICLAERCALLSGRDVDFIMNVFAAWTGVRWGELLAVEGWEETDSPLQLSKRGISTYALDWQLREIGGAVRKAPPKDGSFRILDLPPVPRRTHALGDRPPARCMRVPARRRAPRMQGRRPHAGELPLRRPERRASTALELCRPLPHPFGRRTVPGPKG